MGRLKTINDSSGLSPKSSSLLYQAVSRQVAALLVVLLLAALFVCTLWDIPLRSIDNPVSLLELLPAATLILAGLVLSQWIVLGLWTMRTARRIRFLGESARRFMKDEDLRSGLSDPLQAARTRQGDEIDELAHTLQETAVALVQREKMLMEKEQVLTESEEQYRRIVDHSKAVVFRGYIDWTIDFFDDKIEAVSGYPRQAFASRRTKWLDLVLPEDVESVKGVFREVLRGRKTSYSREYRIRHRDGRTIWVNERSHTFFDDLWDFKYVSGLFFDVTERKMVQEALGFERQQLLCIFDSIADPIFVCDPQTHELLFVNQATKGLFGDVTGRKCYEALQELDSPCPSCSDREGGSISPNEAGYAWEMQNKVNQRWYRCTQRTIRWPDGRRVLCEMSFDIHGLKLAEIELRDAREKLETRVAERTEELRRTNEKLNREILDRRETEVVLRESEERFRLLFENAKDSIFWADTKTGRILACNKSAESLMERSREEIVGHPLTLFQPGGTVPPQDLLFGGMETEGMENIEACVSGGSGRIKDVQISASVTKVGGKPIVQGIFRDITALKHAEKRLKESEQYLGSILDTMHVGVFIIDPVSHRIEDANRFATTMVGVPKEQLLGHICHGFICPAEVGNCPAMDHGVEINNSERLLVKSTGATAPILKSIAKIAKNNKTYLVESFIDITEIKTLLKEQELDITLAKGILNLTNHSLPHYIDISREVALSSCAISLPCHREGGDHYLVREMRPGNPSRRARTLFSLKDQSGHKVGCVLRSIVTDLLHQAVVESEIEGTLEECINLLNIKIHEHGFFSDKDFVTAVNGEIDHETLMLRYVLCAHPSFILISGNNVISLPPEDGPGRNLPLGAVRNAAYMAGQYPLKPGDKIILYTDGLIEAHCQGEDGEVGKHQSRLDMKEVVREILRENSDLPTLDLLAEIIRRVSHISGKLIEPSGINETFDDITLLGMEVERKATYREETWRVGDLHELQNRMDALIHEHEQEWQQRGYEKLIRLRYALSESVLNAWKHGNKTDPNKSIRIRTRYGSDFLLEITDEGSGYDPKQVPDPRYGAGLYGIGGRGLLLIRRHASSAQWHDNGKRVVMTFNRKAGTVD